MEFRKNLFPGQQENETIYLVIRQHWFYFLTKLLVWAICAAFLFIADHYASAYAPDIFASQYYALFKDIYLMFLLLGLFMIWVLYYLNIQIITNRRIVDVSQDSLFAHTVSELNLAKIEDVTGETKGVFGTIFSFGNVFVQTAGSVERFEFRNIPHPDKVEKLILDLFEQLPKDQERA